jgi:hypothetical protein
MTVEANPLMTRLDGPSPAMEVGKDIARHAVIWLPAMVALCAIGWGADGAASAAYGVAIVTVNFLLAAWLLAVTGRISFALMAGAALFGFLIRLGLIFLAVMLVKDASWVSLVPLGLTLIVTHLGLLFWEMRYVSASLAFPGLKPTHAQKDTSTKSTPGHAAEAA